MTHAEAAQIIRAAWRKVHGTDPSDLDVLFVQAVSWLESHYGRHPGQHANWASQGLYTWGNIERIPNKDGSCPDGYYPGKDAGNARCFLLRHSDAEAAEDVVRNLTKRHWPVAAAIQSEGTPEAVAHAMKVAPAYYEAPEAKYAAGLRNAIKAIGQNLPIPVVPVAPSAPSLITGGTVLTVLALGGVGFFLARKRGLI